MADTRGMHQIENAIRWALKTPGWDKAARKPTRKPCAR
jgi:hypothetical protein